MQLNSVRELKTALQDTVITPLVTSVVRRSALGISAPLASKGAVPPTIALGVTRKGPNDFALAVRVQNRVLEHGREIDQIRAQAKGEVDIRYIGEVAARAALPAPQVPSRPLRIGCSIGHYKVTAGTLGAFVRGRADGSTLILSNNHVLANENASEPGDAILQPGQADGGRDPDDRIGTLARFVELKQVGSNAVDCAVANPADGIEYDPRDLPDLGPLAGPGFAEIGDTAAKVGRTTGPTRGRVRTIELDNLLALFPQIGILRFDGQVEIEGDGEGPFSLGGDSGSLIINAERRAVALLFAGSDQGGSDGQGLTFANPLHLVLNALDVDLMTA